jgi:superfamily I DNA/RNA helicase
LRLPAYQDLSREQDRVNNLPLDDSYLVVGPPGTGKTVMALYRAKMLTAKQVKVSLLMFSRLLSQYIGDAAESLDLEAAIRTFHRWFLDFYSSSYGRKYPEVSKFTPDWTAILKQVATEPPPARSLAHLIVDEGQDLASGFFLVARHLAQTLTVFADENQRINEDNSTLDTIRAYTGIQKLHKLTRNYRNTKEIAALAACFYTGLESGIPVPPTRSGDLPVLLGHPSARETIDYILRFERNHPDLEIGVLVPTKRVQSRLWYLLEGKARNPVERYVGGKGAKSEPLSFGRPGIKVICYASAKGLEFDAVFLPELQECAQDMSRPEARMIFYVLISRAREHLFLCYSGKGAPKIVEAFPKELLDWRP